MYIAILWLFCRRRSLKEHQEWAGSSTASLSQTRPPQNLRKSLPAASLTEALWTTHPQAFPVAEGFEGFEGFVVFRETITARSNPFIRLEQGRLLCHLLRCINWVQNVGIYLIQASVPFRSNGFPVTLALLTFSPLPTPRCPPPKKPPVRSVEPHIWNFSSINRGPASPAATLLFRNEWYASEGPVTKDAGRQYTS
jgi:hypothetical protein